MKKIISSFTFCFILLLLVSSMGCSVFFGQKPNPTPHEVTGKYKVCKDCHEKGTKEDAPKTPHLKKEPCDECHKVEPKKKEKKD